MFNITGMKLILINTQPKEIKKKKIDMWLSRRVGPKCMNE